ncbi:glycosyltransferase family 1 protein [Noviherbaspirillum sedimenti]|uniref:Glycosyltransferase family 1 protein n=2 Tax=Noviherbaspirillum sedimenti TaxID=2320865 RepID=A0A3A3G6W1_9BURK|nr:glycosyltransferase family 4 protein [Noviherbaspirillum sedimenti]RJG04263.1 glycosyltransferase family 1 protein [Noviherbaspirillum sedimenti]
MNRKIVISVNTAWNIVNFRSGLIKALIRHGYDVLAVTPDDDYAPRLNSLGCRFIRMPMDNNGTHPGRDLSLLMRYVRVLRSERPMAYLGYTIKPNVYGSIAAHTLGIPVINNIAGLGTTFINRTFLTALVKRLYRFSLRRSHRVFFQNAEDLALFVQSGLVRKEQTDRLPGSGIDVAHYLPVAPASMSGRCFRFLLISRMLKDKGIEEFAAAAGIVRRRIPDAQFQLLGSIDRGNANAISLEQIRAWEANGVIQYLGKTDDVRPFLADADCIVLPSYREGVPRSLLEAAAMARPIIATNVAGCHDVVEDQVNGLLCKVRDAADLAEKMTQMYRLSPEKRMEIGAAGRRKVAAQFDESIVIRKYLDMIDEIAVAGAGSRNSTSGKAHIDTHFRQG